MRVAVVVPAYNEESRIGAVVTALRSVVGDGGEVIAVDDGSADGTAEAARIAGAVVYRHAVNRGQGAALRTGTEAALLRGAEAVVHVDADGQHDPASVAALLAPIAAGECDVVFGSRFMGMAPTGMPASRRMLLWVARRFSLLVLGISRRFTDPQAGTRAMTAAAARSIGFRHDRMAHCSEILRAVSRAEAAGALRWCEVPVRVAYTPETLAKGQRATDAFRIVWQLLVGALAD